MFKKLMVLLLVGCLTLFVGFKTFAADTVNLNSGDSHNESSYTISATIDTYDPFAACLDSNQEKIITDNWNSQYRSHSEHHHENWRANPKERMLLILFGMMIIIGASE
jgi:hypothetical protein